MLARHGLEASAVSGGSGRPVYRRTAMKNLTLALALAAAAAVAPDAARADPEPAGKARQEARIPFPAFGTVRHFEPVGNKLVYLQDRRRRWYRAELAGRCLELPHAHYIGIDTGGGPFVDRFSALVVEGQRCQLRSLTRSEAPPRRRGKKEEISD
jgi:hypothetical protein